VRSTATASVPSSLAIISRRIPRFSRHWVPDFLSCCAETESASQGNDLQTSASTFPGNTRPARPLVSQARDNATDGAIVPRRAPVAQWIEQRFPKPRAHVRFMPGASRLSRPIRTNAGGSRLRCKSRNSARVRLRPLEHGAHGWRTLLAYRSRATSSVAPALGRTGQRIEYPLHIHLMRSTSMVRRGSTVRVRQRVCIKALQMRFFCVACDGEISTLRGYETGTFWDWRALAGTRDVSRHSLERARDTRSRPLTRKVPATRALLLPVLARSWRPLSPERGSTVRVRQRACREAPQKAGFLSSKPATHATPRVREAPRSAATRTRCRPSRSRGSPCRKRGRRPRAESRLAP
jgi:hypothetical protein